VAFPIQLGIGPTNMEARHVITQMHPLGRCCDGSGEGRVTFQGYNLKVQMQASKSANLLRQVGSRQRFGSGESRLNGYYVVADLPGAESCGVGSGD
jgi:hypothetical protein